MQYCIDLTLRDVLPKDGRTVKEGDTVKVYRNLHNDCLSILKNGLVHGYAQYVALCDVTFQVNEKGRQRVLKEKRKNVHAFVGGRILQGTTIKKLGFDKVEDLYKTIEEQGYIRVKYNPYLFDSFVIADTGEKVETARFALIAMDRIYIAR